MRFSIIASALVAPLAVLAVPTVLARSDLIASRQASSSAPPKPKPCVRDSSVSVEETEARFDAFAQAFIYHPNISEAFSHIAQDYINHNPSVSNGFDAAWNVLSPFWDTANITAKRRAFESPMSWVNYDSQFGEIVDRFRWEGGCIVEHWDQNETFPATAAVSEPCDDA